MALPAEFVLAGRPQSGAARASAVSFVGGGDGAATASVRGPGVGVVWGGEGAVAGVVRGPGVGVVGDGDGAAAGLVRAPGVGVDSALAGIDRVKADAEPVRGGR